MLGLLRARKVLQEKAIAIENDIRGLLRNFGLKVGIVGAAKFEARIRELTERCLTSKSSSMSCLPPGKLRDGFLPAW